MSSEAPGTPLGSAQLGDCKSIEKLGCKLKACILKDRNIVLTSDLLVLVAFVGWVG